MNDWRLLREYVDKKSETAFAQLVDKHMKLVYWTCRRDTNDDQLAEDAAQAVFLLLAQKAKLIGANVSISGWLFHTSRLVCRNVNRREIRRKQIEREVAQQMEHSPTEQWNIVEPWLNDALGSLSAGERSVVLLRYVDGLSLQEVAEEIGATDKAVSKRVLRSIDKMRRYLQRREISVTSVVLAALLAEHSAKALPLEAASASALHAIHSFAAGPSAWAVAGERIVTLQKGVHFAMQVIRYKTLAAGVGAVAVIASGVVFSGAMPSARSAAAHHAASEPEADHMTASKLIVVDADGSDIANSLLVKTLDQREADTAHLTFHWDIDDRTNGDNGAHVNPDKGGEIARLDALARTAHTGITDPVRIDGEVQRTIKDTQDTLKVAGYTKKGTFDFVRDGGVTVVRDRLWVVQPVPTAIGNVSNYLYYNHNLVVAAQTESGFRFASEPTIVMPARPLGGFAAYSFGASARYDLSSSAVLQTEVTPEDLALLAGLNPLRTRGSAWRIVSSSDKSVVLQNDPTEILKGVPPIRITLDPTHDCLPALIEYSGSGNQWEPLYQVKSYARYGNRWVCSKVVRLTKGGALYESKTWSLTSVSPSKAESLSLPPKVYVQDSRLLGEISPRDWASQANNPRVINYYWKGSLPSEDELRTMPRVGQN